MRERAAARGARARVRGVPDRARADDARESCAKGSARSRRRGGGRRPGRARAVHPTQADAFSFVHTIAGRARADRRRERRDHARRLARLRPGRDRAVRRPDRRRARLRPARADAQPLRPRAPRRRRARPGRGVPHARGGRLRRLVRRRDLLRQRRVRRRVPRLALGRRSDRARAPCAGELRTVWESR